MPPPGASNQIFHPQAALSPPLSPSLGSKFAPTSPTSFSGPFSPHPPPSAPMPHRSPASSQQETSPDWTLDQTQVGQVTLPVQTLADTFSRTRGNRSSAGLNNHSFIGSFQPPRHQLKMSSPLPPHGEKGFVLSVQGFLWICGDFDLCPTQFRDQFILMWFTEPEPAPSAGPSTSSVSSCYYYVCSCD